MHQFRKPPGRKLADSLERRRGLLRHRFEGFPDRLPVTGLAGSGDVEDVPRPEMAAAAMHLAGDDRWHRFRQQLPPLNGLLQGFVIGDRRRGDEVDLPSPFEGNLQRERAITSVAGARHPGLHVGHCSAHESQALGSGRKNSMSWLSRCPICSIRAVPPPRVSPSRMLPSRLTSSMMMDAFASILFHEGAVTSPAAAGPRGCDRPGPWPSGAEPPPECRARPQRSFAHPHRPPCRTSPPGTG